MRKFIIASLFAALPAGNALARQQQNQPNQAARTPSVPTRRLIMQDAVIVFYVNQFQKQTSVTDETFVKIIPFVRQFVQDRFDITNRKQRALNQLRQTVQNVNASEDELRRAVHDYDAADHDFQANQEKFLANVDPLLTPRQQARFRQIQIQADNQMKKMLDNLQQVNQASQPKPPPANSPD
jgi:hypothetical protein